MVRDNVGSEGRQYFPFIFTLFMFVLFGNLLGMIPSSFTFTSHIVVTLFMALVIFIGVTVIGFARHGAGYLRLFFPHGAPLWTAVILVPIEIISYLSRPISLSVRLFANMMAGHILIKVFAGFVLLMGIAGVVPLAALVGITALEFLVSVLQAYIFTILTCVYLHDAIHMH
ncbi:atpB [Symbiodinium necroappetens]|uniref:F-ATPase protein 6 n=1 Tax=Symbiodinium necroappetens TaxID=1628268 RepID=A0A813BE89_9DINO|nr:atpB [Symbiodinium necroappetens]